MNYEIFEKALTRSSMISVTELAISREKFREIKVGHLYTILQADKRLINIGFTFDMRRLKIKNNEIYFERLGSEREAKIAKETLKELGYFPQSGNNIYSYSNRLIKHLRLMGWPVREKPSKKLKN